MTVEIRKFGGLGVEELTTRTPSHLRAQKKPVCRPRVALVFLFLAPKVSAPTRQPHLFDSRQIVRIVIFARNMDASIPSSRMADSEYLQSVIPNELATSKNATSGKLQKMTDDMKIDAGSKVIVSCIKFVPCGMAR